MKPKGWWNLEKVGELRVRRVKGPLLILLRLCAFGVFWTREERQTPRRRLLRSETDGRAVSRGNQVWLNHGKVTMRRQTQEINDLTRRGARQLMWPPFYCACNGWQTNAYLSTKNTPERNVLERNLTRSVVRLGVCEMEFSLKTLNKCPRSWWKDKLSSCFRVNLLVFRELGTSLNKCFPATPLSNIWNKNLIELECRWLKS